MGKEDKENMMDEQSMREHWLSDLAPLSDAAQQLFSGKEVPMSEEETADLLDEAEFRFPKNKPISESEDAIIQEALVLGGPVGADQDPDAPQLSEEKMQILLGEVTRQLGAPSVESVPDKSRKLIPFKPILSTLGIAAAVMLGFFIFKGDPSVDPDTVVQDQIDAMPQGGAILLAFNGEAQVSEMEGDEKSDFRTLEDGDLLAPGMELKTGAESEAVLLLTNGSLATLGPDSQMRLSEFTQKAFEGTEEKVSELTEEPSESQVLLELDLGELVVEVKKLDKQSSFDLYSHLGFAGIRGTQYRVLATDRSVRLSVLEGKVAVSKERGGLDHLIESERAILLEEDLQKEPDGATVEEIERIKRVNERARKLAEKIKLKDLADAYDEINKRLALALKEKELEQAMNQAIEEGTYIVESAANMEMIWCKPGTFMMGSPETEERRKESEIQHEVTLTNGFFLGKFEVTQEEFENLMGKNPSKFKGKKMPVHNLNWEDAVAFCKRLNEREIEDGRLSQSWAYCLPSEAQWEYACRASTTSVYSWGDEINLKLANYGFTKKIGKTKVVGSYSPNPWGFFDMHGNVWEYVNDWMGDYSSKPKVDPMGPEEGVGRGRRGGAFRAPDFNCRSASRSYGKSTYGYTRGFRLCLRQITDFDKLAKLSSKVQEIPGLVRHWKFDNQEANVSKASVGGFDAKLMGGVKLVTGKIGNAVEVGEEMGYVDFGMGAGDIDGNFSVSFFAKYLGKDPPENYPKLMTNKKSHNSEDGWQLSLLSKREKWGAGSMWVRGSSGKGFGKKVNDDWKAGNWHHIVVSYEGENVTTYSDGKSRGTGKIIPVNKGLKNFTFSTTIKGHGFHGQLDDLRVYDRILTESEIIDIYEMGEYASKLATVDDSDDEKQASLDINLLTPDALEIKDNWVLEDGVMTVRQSKQKGNIWTKEKFGDFKLSLEYKTSEKANSGLFFRADPVDPVQRGFEIQIASPGLYNGNTVVGSLYGAMAPMVEAGKPDGEWNSMELICDGPLIKARLNGQEILDLNIDDWKDAGKNPDGTKNKFKSPLKDLSRSGLIGFQYYGQQIWFRNVIIRSLESEDITDLKTSIEEKFEEAMKKPVGEGIHIVESAANMEMIWCKPGSFEIGKKQPKRKVSLTKGFYLGKYEVTQEQYEKVMDENPSDFKGKTLPVEMVSWIAAKKFCEKLNGLEKKEGNAPDGWVYTLPSETEWEYACRAGTTSAYSWGDNIVSSNANYNWDGGSTTGKDYKQTRGVGQYSANPWGFFDMHGNVWEWTANYLTAEKTAHDGPKFNSKQLRMGGSWYHDGKSLKSDSRFINNRTFRANSLGFRLCLKQVKEEVKQASIPDKEEKIEGNFQNDVIGEHLAKLSQKQKIDEIKILRLNSYNSKWKKHFYNTKIKDHDDFSSVSECKNLTNLCVHGSSIRDLSPFKNLINLTELNINKAKIENIKPLEKLFNLTSLDLSENLIKDLSNLRFLHSLSTLYLSKNKISNQSDLSVLGKLLRLKTLKIDGNPLSDLSKLPKMQSLVNIRVDSKQMGKAQDLLKHPNLINVSILGSTDKQKADFYKLTKGRFGFSPELLRAVNNWKQIPKSVFPIGNVTVFEEVELKFFGQNESVEGEAIIPSGNNFWVLGIEKDMLTISLSEVSKLKGSVEIDETNFKQKVANLFELRKKQRKK